MFKKRGLVSAFDVEGNIVKLAQVSFDNSKGSLYRLVALKSETDKKDDLIEAIRRLVADYRVSETLVVLGLPRHKVTVKTLKLPSVDPAEIENMVDLQAAKQLPFSPEKVIWSYKILQKDMKGYSDIMITLAHRDVVDNILALFNQIGTNIEKLALSSEALSLWYMQRQKEDEKGSCVCLVDISSSIAEIQIINEERLDFTRSFAFISTENAGEKLVDEIKKSLYTYTKTSSTEVRKLILTGMRSIVQREAVILKNTLGIPTVYVDAVRLYPKKEDANMPGGKELDETSFTAVLSLGFNHEKIETNLIPAEIRHKRITKFLKESLIMSVALFLSIAIGLGGISAKKIIEKRRYLASIKKGLADTRPKVDELTRYEELTNIIKRQLNLATSSINIIRELYNIIPPEISLTILDYEDGRSCLLRGTSPRLSDVSKFISVLEESIYFENVKVRYATTRTLRKRELTDFEITCKLTLLAVSGDVR